MEHLLRCGGDWRAGIPVEHGGITGQGLSSTLLLAMTGTKDPPMKDLTSALGHGTQTKVLGAALAFLGDPDKRIRAL